MSNKENSNNPEEMLLNEQEAIEQSEKNLKKLLPEARLIDDYYFTLYAQCYPNDFSMIMSTFLDKDIEIDPSSFTYQKTLNLPDDGKDVRFDIWGANTKDGGNVVIEVESKKKFPELRLRYYMSRMDSNLLSKGETYDKLKNAYLVIVSPVDMRKLNKPRYFVKSCYVESPTEVGKNPAIFEDGQTAVYINASYENEKDKTKLANLIHDFVCPNPDEIKTDIIKEHSKVLKGQGKESQEMLAEAKNVFLRMPLYNGRLLTEIEYRDAKKEGIEKGIEKTKLDIFAKLMKPYLLNKQGDIKEGIEFCKSLISDWDDNKIKKNLVDLQGKLGTELNINNIFLHFEISDKIKDKNYIEAYNLLDKDPNITQNEKPLEFMKEIVKVYGTDGDTLDSAIQFVVDTENESPQFHAKLLKDIMNSKEYKQMLDKEQYINKANQNNPPK